MNKIDTSGLTLQEMVELRDRLNNEIWVYSDGYEYELHIRSYGRNWREKLSNTQSVQDRCYEYDGEDGIIDVYTTNPALSIHNYGDTLYFPTLEDAEKWRNKRYLERNLPEWEKEIDVWETRDTLDYRDRPRFAPMYSREDIARYQEQLADMKDTIEPIRLKQRYENDETDSN